MKKPEGALPAVRFGVSVGGETRMIVLDYWLASLLALKLDVLPDTAAARVALRSFVQQALERDGILPADAGDAARTFALLAVAQPELVERFFDAARMRQRDERGAPDECGTQCARYAPAMPAVHAVQVSQAVQAPQAVQTAQADRAAKAPPVAQARQPSQARTAPLGS
jgi:hypothetical protein